MYSTSNVVAGVFAVAVHVAVFSAIARSVASIPSRQRGVLLPLAAVSAAMVPVVACVSDVDCASSGSGTLSISKVVATSSLWAAMFAVCAVGGGIGARLDARGVIGDATLAAMVFLAACPDVGFASVPHNVALSVVVACMVTRSWGNAAARTHVVAGLVSGAVSTSIIWRRTPAVGAARLVGLLAEFAAMAHLSAAYYVS